MWTVEGINPGPNKNLPRFYYIHHKAHNFSTISVFFFFVKFKFINLYFCVFMHGIFIYFFIKTYYVDHIHYILVDLLNLNLPFLVCVLFIYDIFMFSL